MVPRGGDFCYTNYEFEVMCLDIQHAKNLGADGVVFGILRQDGSVDAERVSKLVKLAQPMQVTFHRAFDLTKDPLKSLEEIISIGGIQRILTSGQNDTVLEGLEMIESLVKHAKGRIIILPGGGIRESNIKRILSEVKLTELHVSASRLVRSVMEHQIINIHMGRAFYSDEYLLNAFDPHKFQNLKSIADQF
ncbi:hypothetical protein G9A89_019192 [Geosiphon pyriformis]|nr:hypothetical protein G9A89_019192 [Geosiphon pyriformis]